MKIRKLTPENDGKVAALLRQAFPKGDQEARLVERLRQNKRLTHEWVGIHTNRVIAYIAFSRAYNGAEVCGLHLGPMAVTPDLQRQGVGSELLRFALRQEEIKSAAIFVLGAPGFFQRFGFAPCATVVSPRAKKSSHFLCLRHAATEPFSVRYEPEFAQ